MHARKLAWLALLLSPCALRAETFAPEPQGGPPTITASYPAEGKPESAIGNLAVAGTGQVTVLANRVQGRLFIRAVAAGTAIGRAESLIGLGDTPLYVQSPQGLYKIVIHWKT